MPLCTNCGRVLLALAWLLPFSYTLPLLLFSKDHYFIPAQLQCGAKTSQKMIWYIYIAFKLSAMAVMVAVNSAILIIARRSSIGRRNNKAVITVSAVCWIFILAYIPTSIACLLHLAKVPPRAIQWFDLFASYMLGVSVVSNWLIYTITNRRFAGFMKKCFCSVFDKAKQITSNSSTTSKTHLATSISG